MAADLQYHIDSPASWIDIPRCLIVRGWCFGAAGQTVKAIRLRTEDFNINGVIGLLRPDVKAALPLAPDDHTGFEIRVTLPSGQYTLTIEVERPDGSWNELITQIVTVKRQIIPRWAGGGSLAELIAFQMPAHMAYAPRLVQPDKFFRAKPSAPRPKLSIVTPSFNQARFLGETMRSVLEQDSVDCEYVVQDGGSSDGSRALIERFASEFAVGSSKLAAEPESLSSSETASASTFRATNSKLPSPNGMQRTFAWVSERDAGQADAIAKGFAKTSGGPDDVMAWINSDDFYLPGALAYVVDYFAQHPDVDVIYGHRIVVDEESREIARWFLPKHDPEVLRLNDFVPQETMFWRRRIWGKVGGIDASFKFAMDWDLLLRFQAAGAKIVRVPYFLACFRVHAAQKTSAQMQSIGQLEINHLRERTQGRVIAPEELEKNSRLLRYLRRSAFIEWLWKLGIRIS